jgi:hypothetical protein
MRYVYELINHYGTVEYVGESAKPEYRFRRHTTHKPNAASSTGKFYKRMDLILNIVAEFETRKESFAFQVELQKEYGLEIDFVKARNIQDSIGRKPMSNEAKEKMRLAKLGKTRPKRTETEKQKISEGVKRYWDGNKS